MRAVERTTKTFVASVREALPGVRVHTERSTNRFGRSHYVYIYMAKAVLKVRISDHAIGMRRALSGEEDLYLHAGATLDHWSIWLSKLARSWTTQTTESAA